MFYSLIENKRNAWLSANDCPVRGLINYIVARGMMRDAQVEAIKTYLFLKIKCGNRPLYRMFCSGEFNTLDLDELSISHHLREFLKQNPAACALYEYATQKNEKGKMLAPELAQHIAANYQSIDFEGGLRQLFYGVDYADYIFSLPMGAGKTYLMAAFIYIDLYFAQNEPDNPLFSHNFLVLIPSGLKSSILGSIREIQEFDPSWVIPEADAQKIKRLVKFEILDEQKAAQKSNTVRNPNAQKIAAHQPFSSLMGLVAVVNAEKIILNRIDDADKAPELFSKEELQSILVANELRDMLGSLPRLSLLVDEVHHAADSEIKLRKVINSWAARGSVNAILGFSGTPYLESAEKIKIGEVEIRNTELSNVVNHYPLITAIKSFLKKPEVKFLSANADDETVLRQGVEDFLDQFGQTVYPGGQTAKQAIYCASIERLEEEIYPLVAQIATERGFNPTDIILKYHRGNKQYKVEPEAELEFKSLDQPLSKKKIVLLVQIGKEGWNCRSLTSVILPHDKACPRNMVLQTSCRCLRQVVRGAEEHALIWLNSVNARVLNDQLQKQQNTTIEAINKQQHTGKAEIERYSRMEHQQLPPIDFYQLKVEYTAEIVEDSLSTADRLAAPGILVEKVAAIATTQDMERRLLGIENILEDDTESLTFNQWLMTISKEGFGRPTMNELRQHTDRLRTIYALLAEPASTRLLGDYDQPATRSNIRKCFAPKRTLQTLEEIVPESASLLQINNLTTPLHVEDDTHFVPKQEDVKRILAYDEKPFTPMPQEMVTQMQAYFAANNMGTFIPPKDDFPYKDQTYHYLPYRFDSNLEIRYFLDTAIPAIRDKQLEIYFNGDHLLTAFKIKCYERRANRWNYIGQYVPDFLLLSRREDGSIHRVCIIETKGEGYAEKFRARREFMTSQFVKQNNDKFGYERFRFLYIEDTMTPIKQQQLTNQTISEFFQ